MDNVTIITLEDNKDYILLDEIKNVNDKYLYLSKKDTNEFVIKKEIIEHGTIYLSGLKNDSEFNEAILLFQKKNA